MNDEEMNLYFLYDKTNKLLEITNEKSENSDSIECFHMHGNNLEQMEGIAKIGLMCFNMGKITNGEGKVSVSPLVALLFLKDIGDEEIDELANKVNSLPNLN